MRRSCFCPKKEDLLAMQQASAENQMLWVQKMNNLRNALWKSFQAGLSIADIKQGKSLPQTAAFPVRLVFKKS